MLDPAHGGTDPGARGTGGERDSDIVVEFACRGAACAGVAKLSSGADSAGQRKSLFRYRDWQGALPGCKCLQSGSESLLEPVTLGIRRGGFHTARHFSCISLRAVL